MLADADAATLLAPAALPSVLTDAAATTVLAPAALPSVLAATAIFAGVAPPSVLADAAAATLLAPAALPPVLARHGVLFKSLPPFGSHAAARAMFYCSSCYKCSGIAIAARGQAREARVRIAIHASRDPWYPLVGSVYSRWRSLSRASP